jgi:hypothetical protein
VEVGEREAKVASGEAGRSQIMSNFVINFSLNEWEIHYLSSLRDNMIRFAFCNK